MPRLTELRDQLQASLGDAYAIERELGGGGMSRVFVAKETALGRRVVVKLLPADLAGGVSIARFRREISVAARRGVATREALFGVLSILCDPVLDPLKSDPRFAALLLRIGARVCPARGKRPIVAHK